MGSSQPREPELWRAARKRLVVKHHELSQPSKGFRVVTVVCPDGGVAIRHLPRSASSHKRFFVRLERGAVIRDRAGRPAETDTILASVVRQLAVTRAKLNDHGIRLGVQTLFPDSDRGVAGSDATGTRRTRVAAMDGNTPTGPVSGSAVRDDSAAATPRRATPSRRTAGVPGDGPAPGHAPFAEMLVVVTGTPWSGRRLHAELHLADGTVERSASVRLPDGPHCDDIPSLIRALTDNVIPLAGTATCANPKCLSCNNKVTFDQMNALVTELGGSHGRELAARSPDRRRH